MLCPFELFTKLRWVLTGVNAASSSARFKYLISKFSLRGFCELYHIFSTEYFHHLNICYREKKHTTVSINRAFRLYFIFISNQLFDKSKFESSQFLPSQQLRKGRQIQYDKIQYESSGTYCCEATPFHPSSTHASVARP